MLFPPLDVVVVILLSRKIWDIGNEQTYIGDVQRESKIIIGSRKEVPRRSPLAI